MRLPAYVMLGSLLLRVDALLANKLRGICYVKSFTFRLFYLKYNIFYMPYVKYATVCNNAMLYTESSITY